jgi:hypothetical protein
MEQTGVEQYQNDIGVRRRLAVAWRIIWPVFRQVLGWLFILLGLIGLVLPILQGVIFLVIGIALVGRRHPLIRYASVYFKLFLRHWAAINTPLLGPLGRMALRGQQEVSRQRRRLHFWWVERRQNRQQPVAKALADPRRRGEDTK